MFEVPLLYPMKHEKLDFQFSHGLEKIYWPDMS